MGFTVDKKEFQQSIASVMPAISARSSLPILSGIRLTGADTRYSIEATDLELRISLQSRADGQGSSVESAVVPAKALANAVKSIAADELSVSVREDDDRTFVELSAGNRSVTLDALSPKDFPEIPTGIEWKAVCWFEAKELADALSRVVLCASSDEARPILTGVQFNFTEDAIELVATDSYRLGVLSIQTEKMGEVPEYAPIVPGRVLKAMAKQLKKNDKRGIVYVGNSEKEQSDDNLVQFSFGSVCWITRQIAGDYPNWRQLIPAQTGGIFEFDARELSTAVKGAAQLRAQKSTPVRISLGDRCAVRMKDAQVAEVAEDLEKAAFNPDGVGPMDVAFNPDFLLDAIAFVGEDRATMRATDASKPALFHGENGGRYVLMPVRLAS